MFPVVAYCSVVASPLPRTPTHTPTHTHTHTHTLTRSPSLPPSFSVPRLTLYRHHTDGSIFTEGAIVVLRGQVDPRNQTRFVVTQMVMLPAEPRTKTLSAMDIVDPLDPHIRSNEFIQKHNLEVTDKNVAIIIISDCCFGNTVVCENLRTIFSNYEMQPDSELLFVLLGPFVSKDFNSTGGRQAANAAFTAFGETLSECPRLCEHCRFLLVPSPKDAGYKASWPRRPLPEELVKSLRKKIKKLTLAGNPCRVQFYNQEIVFFREDMLRKMQRHSLQLPKVGGGGGGGGGDAAATDATDSLQGQVLDTILKQAHLYPLPATTKPIAWELDYVMRLHPLPQILVMADHAGQYEHSHKESGCKVINPGSFSADTSFVTYYPWNKHIDFSALNA